MSVSLVKMFVREGTYLAIYRKQCVALVSGQTACDMVARGSRCSFQRIV